MINPMGDAEALLFFLGVLGAAFFTVLVVAWLLPGHLRWSVVVAVVICSAGLAAGVEMYAPSSWPDETIREIAGAVVAGAVVGAFLEQWNDDREDRRELRDLRAEARAVEREADAEKRLIAREIAAEGRQIRRETDAELRAHEQRQRVAINEAARELVERLEPKMTDFLQSLTDLTQRKDELERDDLHHVVHLVKAIRAEFNVRGYVRHEDKLPAAKAFREEIDKFYEAMWHIADAGPPLEREDWDALATPLLHTWLSFQGLSYNLKWRPEWD